MAIPFSWGVRINYTISNLVAALRFSSLVFFLIIGFVVASITINVHLHEFGHYWAAEHYELDPEVHITNVVELNSGEIRLNMNPLAYTEFKDPFDTDKNLRITLAGPIMNIMLTILFVLPYLILRRIIRKKMAFMNLIGDNLMEWKWLRVCFILDVIFISLIVPSLVSSIVNLSNAPGSDGAYIRELLKTMSH